MSDRQDFPPALLRLSPRLFAVASDFSVQAINTTSLPDGARVYAQDTKTDYVFRRDATDAASGAAIIAPAAGPGRWFQLADNPGQYGVLIVDNVAALEAVSTSSTAQTPNGITAYVRSVQDYFILDIGSSDTADAITVVQPTVGGGRWLRRNTAARGWALQADWYINATTGDDENTGADSLHPLKTHSELVRRLNGQTLQQSTTVHIETDLDATLDAASTLDVTVDGAYLVRYVGTPTVLASGTLTSQTASNRPSNVQQSVTDSGQDFSAYVGKRIAFATATPSVAWIAKIVTANTEVRISEPMSYASTPPQSFGSVEDLSGLPTYEVQSLPNVRALRVRVYRPILDAASGDILSPVFESLSYQPDVAGAGYGFLDMSAVGGVTPAYYGCEIATTLLNVGQPLDFVDCYVHAPAAGSAFELRGQTLVAIGGLFDSFALDGALESTGVALLLQPTFDNGIQMNPGSRIHTDAGIGIFDFIDTALGVSGQASFAQEGTDSILYGASAEASATGVSLVPGAIFLFATPDPPTIAATAGAPAADLSVGGYGAASWAEVPNGLMASWTGLVPTDSGFGAVQSGSASLTNGVATISGVYVSNNARIFLTRSSVSGTPVGMLEVFSRFVGNPGSGNFVVHAIDTTGATATGDQGAFDWLIIN